MHGFPRRKGRWQLLPTTIGLQDKDNGIQDRSPIIDLWVPGSACCRQQWCESVPHQRDHIIRAGCGISHLRMAWSGHLHGRCSMVGRPPPIPPPGMMPTRPALVPPSPPRPLQDGVDGARVCQHHGPKQVADFGATQPDRSPRWALKVAKLVVSPVTNPFFGGGGGASVSMRITAKNACAHMANVTWRYQPVQLRTSY